MLSINLLTRVLAALSCCLTMTLPLAQPINGGAAVGPNKWVVGDSKLPEDPAPWGKTFYVRPDGGDEKRCSGRVDKPAAGATGRDCAWSGPMIALPPDGTALIDGGDQLVIRPGSYMMGYGAPGTEGKCSRDYPWDCFMQPVPSGPDAKHPTRIVGGSNTQGGAACAEMPELWGTEAAKTVLNLKGSSNVRLACLDVTDHSECVAFHSGGIRCGRDGYPFGRWAQTGLSASDSKNVQLINLDIHGLASAGVSAGRLTDWQIDNLRLAANGWVGWEGDIGAGSSSNSGVMRFNKWLVEYNGCGETLADRKPYKCWAQTAGGYGDGVGTAQTEADWLIENSIFRFNTSDGLDLLYHRGKGLIRLNRIWAEGNAGNQVKTNGLVVMTNSVIIGTCGYFKGKPFTHHVDDCRAMGDAIAASAASPGDVLRFTNNTVVSEGNVVAVIGGEKGSKAVFTNNILLGRPFVLSPDKNSADLYLSDRGMTLEEVSSLKLGLRSADCGRGGSRCADPGLVIAPERAMVVPPPLSAARNAGAPVGSEAGPVDYYGRPRVVGGRIDIGALEIQ